MILWNCVVEVKKNTAYHQESSRTGTGQQIQCSGSVILFFSPKAQMWEQIVSGRA